MGHLQRDPAGGLESLQPADAFFLVDGLFIAVSRIGKGFPRPQLGPGAPQGNTVQPKGLQGVEQQAPAGLALVAHRSEPLRLLERVITEGGRVLSQKDNPLGRHAAPGVVLMRGQQILKLQLCPAAFHQRIGGFAPSFAFEAGIKAPVRMRETVRQHPGKPLVQFHMPQVQSIQLLLHPMTLVTRAKDRTGHHRRQAPGLQLLAGSAIQ